MRFLVAERPGKLERRRTCGGRTGARARLTTGFLILLALVGVGSASVAVAALATSDPPRESCRTVNLRRVVFLPARGYELGGLQVEEIATPFTAADLTVGYDDARRVSVGDELELCRSGNAFRRLCARRPWGPMSIAIVDASSRVTVCGRIPSTSLFRR